MVSSVDWLGRDCPQGGSRMVMAYTRSRIACPLPSPHRRFLVTKTQVLNDKGYAEPLREYIKADKPFFGICLGMQTLFEGSEESPGVAVS